MILIAEHSDLLAIFGGDNKPMSIKFPGAMDLSANL